MIVKVCVGSSCHLKGSYAVIENFKKLIEKYNVSDKVELQASFCLGRCSTGVTVLADDRFIDGVNENNTEEIFVKEIMSSLK